MQLMRLEVKNWCQHTFRVCSFTRGLVAILGRIGSGKSNLLGAICWLLTGENPNSGVKADNVAQLAVGDDSAYAKLEFEHAGHLVIVTRYLLPEKEQATLVVDNVEVARGDKAVTAQIEQLLGIDSKFISRFVIVAQTELFAFIEEGPAETDRFFQKLFGTANAEKCQDAIGKHLSKLTIPEILVPSTTLAGQVNALDEQLQVLADQINELPATEAFISGQKAHNDVVQNWAVKQQLLGELASCNAQVKAYTEKLDELTKACEQHNTDVQAIKDVIAGNQDAHSSAKAALSHLATYRQIAKAKEATKKRLGEIAEKRKAKLAAEPVVVTPAEQGAANADLQKAQHELDCALQFIKTFTADGVANCPTCHTPVTDLAAELANTQKALPGLEETVKNCKKTVADFLTKTVTRSVWETELDALALEETQLLSSAKTFSGIEPPATSEEELVKLVSDHENLQKALVEIEPIAQRAREKKSEITGLLSAAVENKTKRENAIAIMSVSEADAQLAKAALLVLEQQFAERQGLERNHAKLQLDRDNMFAQFQEAQQNEQKAAMLRKWYTVAETARLALKTAPKLVTKRNLQRLEVAINELLQVFGVEFFIRAATDDSSSFVAEFFDGRKQPAKRLSYGQKTVLALAFRVAVNSLFAEHIGC